jgi:iron(III) transport system permease protein
MKANRLLLVVAIAVLLYGVIYPNAAVVISSFQRAGAWTLANYREVLSQGVVIEAIVSSLGLSIGTVVLCALVGVPLAFLFERFTFPGRRLFAAIAALPLVLPPLVGTVAFIFLAGETGILAHAIQNLLGLENPPWRLTGWPALLLFHTYTMYPFFYVLTGAGLRRIDASLAEAARSLGGSRVFVFTRVLAPQLTPSLIAAALLTFMTSMASFSAPLLFGGNVRVLTLEIFTARQRGDTTIAVTETVILAVISLAALIVFQRYEGTRKFAAATMKGAPRRRVTIASGKARVLAAAVAVIFAIVLVLPVATLVLVSFAREGSFVDDANPACCLYVCQLSATLQRSLRCRSLLQQFFDVGDCGAGSARVEFLRRNTAGETRARQAGAARTKRAAIAFVVDPDSVGAAGNGGRGFGRRGVRTAEFVDGFVRAGWHVLDFARRLFFTFHAAGCARASGKYGTGRSGVG